MHSLIRDQARELPGHSASRNRDSHSRRYHCQIADCEMGSRDSLDPRTAHPPVRASQHHGQSAAGHSRASEARR